jgi:hypothetical protein
MDPGAVIVIDALKPYRGGNEPLALLYDLNNYSKHRMLVTVGMWVHLDAEWIGRYNLGTGFFLINTDPHFSGIYDPPEVHKMQMSPTRRRSQSLTRLGAMRCFQRSITLLIWVTEFSTASCRSLLHTRAFPIASRNGPRAPCEAPLGRMSVRHPASAEVHTQRASRSDTDKMSTVLQKRDPLSILPTGHPARVRPGSAIFRSRQAQPRTGRITYC